MGLHHDPAASARPPARMDRIIEIDREITDLKTARQSSLAASYRSNDEAIKFDQRLLALRQERQRLVGDNQADEYLAEGKRWHGKGEVISLVAYRNRMRFKVSLTPKRVRRQDAA